MAKLNKKKKGVTIVFLAISMAGLLLFAATVIDIGMLALNKSNLQNACDAAALAGAQELAGAQALSIKQEAARVVAKEYARNNGVEDQYIQVTFPNSNKITVKAVDKPVGFFFAKIIGISQGLASASASAVIAPVSNGISGLRPFGLLVTKNADGTLGTEFNPGDPYTLKQDAGDGTGGNFQWLYLPNTALTGNNNILESNILNGNPNLYSVGDDIASVTGVATSMLIDVKTLYNSCPAGCTHSVDSDTCKRIITVPILEKPATITGSTIFEIIGFAKFMLNNLVQDGNGNGHIEVQGTFIEQVTVGGVDPTQPGFDLNGVKLTD
jgi:hypothetical protein